MFTSRFENWRIAVFRLTWAPTALLVYVLALFGPTLYSFSDHVMSDLDVRYFAVTREFGFNELHAGNLPLWNPYVFSGGPYLANFQSALLYPPNLIYLALPLCKALNIELALHMWLLGVFMYAWARGRRLGEAAALFSAVLMMSSGAFYAHIHAGHFTMIDAWAWVPFIFLAVDKLLDRASLAWVLAGAFGVTMQILAGHPQCVFFTGFAVGLYCIALLPAQPRPWTRVPALTMLAMAPLFLSAAQLWPGLAAAREGARAGVSGYAFSSMFSLPPESVMRMAADEIFGRTFGPYPRWSGRTFEFESALFVGVAGSALALFGALYSKDRRRWLLAGLAALMLLISFGGFTPVFRWIYALVPGFSLFRVPARLTFYSTLFLALLAGMGLEWLIRRADRKELQRAAFAAVLLASLLVLAGVVMSRRSTVNPAALVRVAAIGAIVGALCWAASRKQSWARWGVVLIGLAELGAYTYSYRTEFDLSSLRSKDLATMASEHLGDSRILDGDDESNRLVHYRIHGLWGSDPVRLRRYGELMKSIGGPEPEHLKADYPALNQKLASLLRAKYAIRMEGPVAMFTEIGHPLPHAFLVRDYRVVAADHTLEALHDSALDPRKTVLLEQTPEPLPEPGEPHGVVTVAETSTDCLTIDAELPEAAILVITDAYSEGWRVRAPGPAAQPHYDVMVADYALRAVPLAAGRHRILLEYAPQSFRIGKWVSVVAWAGFAAAALVCVWRRWTSSVEPSARGAVL